MKIFLSAWCLLLLCMYICIMIIIFIWLGMMMFSSSLFSSLFGIFRMIKILAYRMFFYANILYKKTCFSSQMKNRNNESVNFNALNVYCSSSDVHDYGWWDSYGKARSGSAFIFRVLLNRSLDNTNFHSSVVESSCKQQCGNEEHANVSQEYPSVILKARR